MLPSLKTSIRNEAFAFTAPEGTTSLGPEEESPTMPPEGPIVAVKVWLGPEPDLAPPDDPPQPTTHRTAMAMRILGFNIWFSPREVL
jgi:hypothetical protein